MKSYLKVKKNIFRKVYTNNYVIGVNHKLALNNVLLYLTKQLIKLNLINLSFIKVVRL